MILADSRMRKGYVAYAGLIPSAHASGSKVFHGRITKTGSKWLRRAAIEAAQTAIWGDSEFHAYCQRIRIGKGTNAARVANAHRLLTVAYRLLRQGRFYEKRTARTGKIVTRPPSLLTS